MRPTRPQAVQEITGIPAAQLERAAHIYGEAQSGSLLWGLGVTEHKYGSEVVQLLCNLAMMTGKVGKPGSALLPLRGQNNVQGSSDMGALARHLHRLPAGVGRERRPAVRGGVGRPAQPRQGLHDPADVRRGGRRRSQGDVHLRRGRRPDRPRHRPRHRGAGEPRVRRLPGDLRERDDQVRRCRAAGLGVPGEVRHVHQRRAALPGGRAGDRSRPAARGRTSTSS